MYRIHVKAAEEYKVETQMNDIKQQDIFLRGAFITCNSDGDGGYSLRLDVSNLKDAQKLHRQLLSIRDNKLVADKVLIPVEPTNEILYTFTTSQRKTLLEHGSDMPANKANAMAFKDGYKAMIKLINDSNT